MKYGKMTVEQNYIPVEVGFLVENQQPSGPFIANRERRGISISDNVHQISLTADEALMLLEWFREQEPVLKKMIDEEAEALAAVEQRQAQTDEDVTSRPSQAEGERETIEADLEGKEADRMQ